MSEMEYRGFLINQISDTLFNVWVAERNTLVQRDSLDKIMEYIDGLLAVEDVSDDVGDDLGTGIGIDVVDVVEDDYVDDILGTGIGTDVVDEDVVDEDVIDILDYSDEDLKDMFSDVFTQLDYFEDLLGGFSTYMEDMIKDYLFEQYDEWDEPVVADTKLYTFDDLLEYNLALMDYESRTRALFQHEIRKVLRDNWLDDYASWVYGTYNRLYDDLPFLFPGRYMVNEVSGYINELAERLDREERVKQYMEYKQGIKKAMEDLYKKGLFEYIEDIWGKAPADVLRGMDLGMRIVSELGLIRAMIYALISPAMYGGIIPDTKIDIFDDISGKWISRDVPSVNWGTTWIGRIGASNLLETLGDYLTSQGLFVGIDSLGDGDDMGYQRRYTGSGGKDFWLRNLKAIVNWINKSGGSFRINYQGNYRMQFWAALKVAKSKGLKKRWVFR